MSLDKLAILTSVKQRAINKLQVYKVGAFFFFSKTTLHAPKNPTHKIHKTHTTNLEGGEINIYMHRRFYRGAVTPS